MLQGPDIGNTTKKLDIMPKSEQEQFTSKYAVELLNTIIKDGETTLYNYEKTPNEMYGKSVVPRFSSGVNEKIYSVGDNTKGNVWTKIVNAGYPIKVYSAGTFKMPGNFLDYKLLNVKWKNKGENLAIPVQINAKNKNSLMIDMAIDSTDKINNMKNQNLTIRLTDSNGKKADYSLNDQSNLVYQKGDLLEEKDWENNTQFVYSTFTPLVTAKIPLHNFANVDLEKIVSIDLIFDKTGQGSIMLKNIDII